MKVSDVENLHTEGERGTEDLARLAAGLGYDTPPQQLLFDNGCSVSGILNMLEDNPGMICAIYEFVQDNEDCYQWSDEDEEEDEEERDG